MWVISPSPKDLCNTLSPTCQIPEVLCLLGVADVVLVELRVTLFWVVSNSAGISSRNCDRIAGSLDPYKRRSLAWDKNKRSWARVVPSCKVRRTCRNRQVVQRYACEEDTQEEVGLNEKSTHDWHTKPWELMWIAGYSSKHETQSDKAFTLISLVPPAWIEHATCGLGNRCSIHWATKAGDGAKCGAKFADTFHVIYIEVTGVRWNS